MSLDRLGVDDVASLLETADASDTPEFARRLHAETEGLPLAVVSYLEELEPDTGHGDEDPWPLPQGLEHPVPGADQRSGGRSPTGGGRRRGDRTVVRRG